MNHKNIKVVLLPLLVTMIGGVGLLIARGAKKNDSLEKDTISNNGVGLDKEGISALEIDYGYLAIDPQRCSGCGKCAMVDSEHFEMLGVKAVVVSSKNLSSNNLAMAINMCRDRAISLK